MRSTRPFLAALASVRAFLTALLGSLAWFIWAATQQTNGSCYGTSHYVPSAVTTLVVMILLTVASRRPWHQTSTALLIGQAVATAAWSALGLSLAIWLSAAISCSA
jgi:hypothetical protein